MNLKVINSNSSGNAYILENEKEALLIECGVNFKNIKAAINFNINKISGCILTHEHGDHAKYAKDVIGAGINLYATEGTFRALGIQDSHRAIVTFSGDAFSVGNFRVKAFKIEHDVNEPVGFLIWHPECGTILFMTDTYFCEFDFSYIKFNNIIIEANYDQEVLDNRVLKGSTEKFLRDRVLTSHMSIDTCKKTLLSYDLSQVNNIVLIHLSDSNSNENKFLDEIRKATGKMVHAAVSGMNIPFNKTAF